VRTGAEIGAAQQDLPRLVIQRETAQLAVFLLMRLEKYTSRCRRSTRAHSRPDNSPLRIPVMSASSIASTSQWRAGIVSGGSQ
jgi:hypothetical protein